MRTVIGIMRFDGFELCAITLVEFSPSHKEDQITFRDQQACGGFSTLLRFLVFIAISLDGLSMEITDAYVYDIKKALIVGPVSETFNYLGYTDLPKQIRAA